ncbi:MAG: nitrogenase component 1 [Rhodospirillales bacterium]
MASSVATLVIGPSLAHAANAMKARTGIDDYRFPHLMGLDACDAFTDAMRTIAGGPVPARIEQQRAQLLDAMVDCHFIVGSARVAVAADPDLLGQLTTFLVGVGVDVGAAVSSARSDSFGDLPLAHIVVGDLEDLEDIARGRDVHLVIANSHAVQTAARLGVPLLRAGFPQHDYFGGHARAWIGYRGSRQTLLDLANLLSAARRPIAPYRSRYRAGEEAAS